MLQLLKSFSTMLPLTSTDERVTFVASMPLYLENLSFSFELINIWLFSSMTSSN